MDLAKILVIAVCATWLVIYLIYLFIKDIHDRKYNKVLMTKMQMYEKDKSKLKNM